MAVYATWLRRVNVAAALGCPDRFDPSVQVAPYVLSPHIVSNFGTARVTTALGCCGQAFDGEAVRAVAELDGVRRGVDQGEVVPAVLTATFDVQADEKIPSIEVRRRQADPAVPLVLPRDGRSEDDPEGDDHGEGGRGSASAGNAGQEGQERERGHEHEADRADVLRRAREGPRRRARRPIGARVPARRETESADEQDVVQMLAREDGGERCRPRRDCPEEQPRRGRDVTEPSPGDEVDEDADTDRTEEREDLARERIRDRRLDREG